MANKVKLNPFPIEFESFFKVVINQNKRDCKSVFLKDLLHPDMADACQ